MLFTVPNPTVTGSDLSASVGDLANLTCIVSDNPTGTTITYLWTKNGTTLTPSAAYHVLPQVGVAHAGAYTCTVTINTSVSNPHVIPGTSSVDVILNVTSKWRYKVVSFTFSILQVCIYCIAGNIDHL